MEITSISNLSVNATTIAANLGFYNPNPSNIKMTYAAVALSIDDKPVSQCIIDSTINIPKMDSFFIPVVFTVNLQPVLNNAFQMLLNGQVKMKAEGTIKLKKTGIGFTVPVLYEQTLPLNALLNK